MRADTVESSTHTRRKRIRLIIAKDELHLALPSAFENGLRRDRLTVDWLAQATAREGVGQLTGACKMATRMNWPEPGARGGRAGRGTGA